MAKTFSSLTGLVALSLIGFVPASAQTLKRAKDCEAEYKANKPAIQAAKELKRD